MTLKLLKDLSVLFIEKELYGALLGKTEINKVGYTKK